MASMTRLRRRLQRWQRYADRYGYPSPAVLMSSWGDPLKALPLVGHCRAWDAVEIQSERRMVRFVYWPYGITCDDMLPVSDEARRIADHADACWQGCGGLHCCPDCGHHGCEGDCDEAYGDLGDAVGYGDAWEPMPVVTVPDISLYDAAVVQADTQDGAR